MKTEDLKKILKKKNSILIGCVVILLILFILIDYIFLVRKSYKVLAPGNENSGIEPPIETSTNDTNGDIKENSTIASNNFNTVYQEGIVLFNNNDLDGTIMKMNEAIQIDLKNPESYLLKSSAEYKKGLTTEAIQTVEKGLEYNPNDENLKTKLDLLRTKLYGPQEP